MANQRCHFRSRAPDLRGGGRDKDTEEKTEDAEGNTKAAKMAAAGCPIHDDF